MNKGGVLLWKKNLTMIMITWEAKVMIALKGKNQIGDNIVNEEGDW